MHLKKQIPVFIVDDNKIFAMTLKASIENAFKEISIHLFETGESCLEALNPLMPELVILDYYLNSGSSRAADGSQVLLKIKQRCPETGVIMLTSNNHVDTVVNSFHQGAADYIVKTTSQFLNINTAISKIFSDKKIAFQKKKSAALVIENIIANKTLAFQNDERIKREAELLDTNQKLNFYSREKEKHEADLALINIRRSEIERSKLIAEERNKNITDSLNYAKRIQQAKLPKKEEIYAALTESFILFKPKDIVSGDFYFFYKYAKSVLIAAADCTGHGVPGAFMSLIGLEKLNTLAAARVDVSEILNRLNQGVKKSLRQSDNYDSPKDGMDIALCSVNVKKRVIKYTAANRPLWIIRKGSIIIEEIKATKKAIGGFTDDDQYFGTHEIKLNKGDTFYIFSDGYADTFGGPYGKKLMTRKFKEILISIQNRTMPDQKVYLDDFIEGWKGEEEQVDDILVIGVRL